MNDQQLMNRLVDMEKYILSLKDLCRAQHEALKEYRDERCILESTVGELINLYNSVMKS